MERDTGSEGSASPDADGRDVSGGRDVVATRRMRVDDRNDRAAAEVGPTDAAPDFEALKQKPIVDCAAFKELNRTEEFKNLLDFLDSIEIDDDENSFSYVNQPATNGLEEPKKETTKFETDGIFTRKRHYSKQDTPDCSYSSNYFDSDSIYKQPKSTVSYTSPRLKQLASVIPPTDPKTLEFIARDSDKIITIGGVQKVLRFYNETALTFVSINDPRTITFEGVSVNIIIDDTILITCFFNRPNVGFVLNNQLHTIRLGSPTRELYIDDNFYSCTFNGPPIQCVLDNVTRSIKIIGDPHSVTIGDTTQRNLVAGISHIIVDSFHPVVVYLDAKPQCIDVGKSKLVLRFVNKFMSVLINNQFFNVDYDGEPLEINVQGNLHLLDFKKLQLFIDPGFTTIFGMLNIVPTEYTTNSSPVPSSSNSIKNTLKSYDGVQECIQSLEKKDPSVDFSDSNSLTVLQIIQSDLVRQINQIESNQISPIIPSPTIHEVLPNNVNAINKVSNKFENDEYQFDNNSLYDPWDTELEIAYYEGFHTKKRKMSTPKPDSPKNQLTIKKKHCHNQKKKSMSR